MRRLRARSGTATPCSGSFVEVPSRPSKRMRDDWTAAMRAHDFARAWEINDRDLAQRIAAGDPKHRGPRHLQHIWRGEPLAGRRVLVRCYHGLGDTLQFIRYAAHLAAIAREVIVWCQPQLIPLLSGVAGIDRLLPLHDGAPDVAYDVDIEVMELPYAFRSTLDSIPATVPYIEVEPAPLARDERLAVGVVWSVGNWETTRSVPPELLAPLASVPGVALHALQRG